MWQAVLNRLQSKLSFEGWQDYPQFNSRTGLGRNVLIGVVLGVLWGIHATLFLVIQCGLLEDRIAPSRLLLLLQWCLYAVALTSFHLLEFFLTAVSNPTFLSADSFLVNHSTSYTAAALSSWTEFGLRCWLRPGWNVSKSVLYFAFVLLVVSQCLRSLAMHTAGRSFTHIIQTRQREEHRLITHGIYYYLRHPSYVGFYYWSISTQLLLGNPVHLFLFGIVSWMFFQRRIAYEEASLCRLFPQDYPAYVKNSWMGIPFLRTKIRSD